MPKQKTRKSVAKRFKKTAGGKLKYSKAGAGHLMQSKTRKRKRTLRKSATLSKPDTKRLTNLI